MAVWAATILCSRCSKRLNSCFLIDMSPVLSALEPDKPGQLVSQSPAGFNECYLSKSSKLSERSPPIVKRMHKSSHNVLNASQESISASTSSKGYRKWG